MSHNLYTLNNEGANVVSYHGANDGILYFGFGSTDAYPASLTTGTAFEWYAPASERINTIGATFGTGSSAGWINSITLPAGTYLFNFYCLVPTVTTNAAYDPIMAVLCEENGTENYFLRVYNQSKESLNGRDNKYGFRRNFVTTYTSSTTLTFEISITAFGSCSDAGGRISETQFFFVRRLL